MLVVSRVLRRFFGERSAQVWTVMGGVATVAALLVALAQLRGGEGSDTHTAASAVPTTTSAVPSATPLPSGAPTATSGAPTGSTDTPDPTVTAGPEIPFALDEGASYEPLKGQLRVSLVSSVGSGAIKVVLTDLQTRKSVHSDWIEVGDELSVGRFSVQVTCSYLCSKGEAEFVAYRS
jgi:hypothetical protein